jgi:PAS domain S-box-containing protein
MKISQKLTISYLLITLLVGLVALFGLNAAKEIVRSFEGGEKELRAVVASATQVSSFVARANGHLMLYLVLDDETDRNKFYSRHASLLRHISELDSAVTTPRAVDIVSRMKLEFAKLLPSANSLIEAHDSAVKSPGGFDPGRYGGLVRDLNETAETVRSLGVELAEFETDFLNRQEAITAASELGSFVKQAEGHMMLFLTLDDEMDRQEFLDRYAELLRRFHVLDKRVKGRDGRMILENIRTGVDELLPTAQALIERHEEEIKGAGRFDYEKHKGLLRRLNEVSSVIRNNGVELARLNIAEETGKMANAMAAAESIQAGIIYIAAASIALAMLLGYLMSRSISRPINRLSEAALEIGRGRLDIELGTGSRDEVGRLAESMTRMAGELKKTTVSKEYLDEIFNNMLTSLVVLTPDAKVQMVNRTACDLFGYAEGELMGRSMGELFEDDLIIERSFGMALIDKGFMKSVEHTCVTADGRAVPVLLSASIMRTRDGDIDQIVVVINDITEHKKALEEREIIKAQLSQAQKMEAVGQLTGGIAHDFNNMLMVITMHADSLLLKLKEESLRTKLTRIRNVTDKATSLTQRLLAFSRRSSADFKPANLNTLILNSEKFLSRVIGEDIRFVVSLSGDDLPITADSGQVDQVLMNLASNARDAMPDGGTLTITTERGSVDEDFISRNGFGEAGTYACVNVEDTGTGMKSETMDNIFNPFFTTKGEDKGTGLGLSVVYGIVKQHKGFITVTSRLGEGTRFRVYFPMSKHAIRVDEPREMEPVHPGNETLLVAEDDAELRRLTVNTLEEIGYRVIGAEDGEDAVIKLVHNMDAIKLVVLDVVMPVKNGKEAYDEMLKVSPDTKALFLSGYTMDVVAGKGITEEANFMHKPLSVPDLSKKIREVLDS